VKATLRRQFEQEKRKILRRLEPFVGGTDPRIDGQPEFGAPRPTYEMAKQARAISCGGVPAMLALAKDVGLRVSDFLCNGRGGGVHVTRGFCLRSRWQTAALQLSSYDSFPISLSHFGLLSTTI